MKNEYIEALRGWVDGTGRATSSETDVKALDALISLMFDRGLPTIAVRVFQHHRDYGSMSVLFASSVVAVWEELSTAATEEAAVIETVRQAIEGKYLISGGNDLKLAEVVLNNTAFRTFLFAAGQSDLRFSVGELLDRSSSLDDLSRIIEAWDFVTGRGVRLKLNELEEARRQVAALSERITTLERELRG